jgi:23S rRNA pseudouridine1911/1915/1917 synthase
LNKSHNGLPRISSFWESRPECGEKQKCAGWFSGGEKNMDQHRIVYQDEQCIVVNKLPGEAAECFAGTSPAAFPRPVHRLDVPVSGCLLLARTPGALAFLSAAFAGENRRGIEKKYWAVTEMPPPGLDSGFDLSGPGELIHWIKTDQRNNKSAVFDEEGPGRKKAILRYRLLGRGQRYLFFEITLVTGRHHQIRAQFARMGLPVKGDLKYGARRSEKGGGIRLHAASLCFPDPVRKERLIRAEAPPPVRDSLWDALILQHGGTV